MRTLQLLEEKKNMSQALMTITPVLQTRSPKLAATKRPEKGEKKDKIGIDIKIFRLSLFQKKKLISAF